jgi:hypothetical protein
VHAANEVRHRLHREGPIVFFLSFGGHFFVPILDFQNVPYGWKHTTLCSHKLPNGFNEVVPKLFMIAPYLKKATLITYLARPKGKWARNLFLGV